MNKNDPIFPENWPSGTRHTRKWKEPETQENICPVCHYYSGRFKHDGVCQFCGYEVKRKEEPMGLDQLKVIDVCGKKVIKYNHHGNEVFVLKDDVGKHRDHCLCWICGKFYPEPEVPVKTPNMNCPQARMLYLMCVLFKLVTPVWECPDWIPPRPDQIEKEKQ